MKVIDQSYKIINISNNIYKTIEDTARICYQSKRKKLSSKNFVENLIVKKHHAMIEFSDITIKFITNRGISHELVRHRLCSFAQESTRYVNYKNELTFITPIPYYNKTFYEAWTKAMQHAEETYINLINNKHSPEIARDVLPHALKTEIIIKANIREWRHILKLRCSKKAHPQMYGLMRPLLADLTNKYPILFSDITY